MKRLVFCIVFLFVTAGCASGPSSLEVRFDAAWKLHREKDYAGARDAYVTLAREFPDEAIIENNLGDVLMKLGDPVAAQLHFEEAAKLDDENALYRYNLGNTCMARDMHDDATGAYIAAVNLDPDAPEYHYALCLSYDQRGYGTEAATACREALKVDGRHVPALRWLARYRYDEMAYREAFGYFKTLIEIDNREEDLYFYMAICFINLRKYDKALDLMKLFLETFKDADPARRERVGNFVKKMEAIVERLKERKEAGLTFSQDAPPREMPKDTMDKLLDEVRDRKKEEKPPETTPTKSPKTLKDLKKKLEDE